MAQAVLKSLEDQLNCSICLGTYTNPKLLQCNHVFCHQCLDRLVSHSKQGRLILICPSCRQVMALPEGGVDSLPAAFHVNQLLEIVHKHKKESVGCEMSSEFPALSKQSTICCLEHREKEVELYCETCEKTVCWKCIAKGGKHHSHNYEELGKAFKKYKDDIRSLLEPVEKQLVVFAKALMQLDARSDMIFHQRGTIEADIQRTIARLHEILDARKTELIDQLNKLTQAKLKSLTVQRDQIETTQAQLNSYLLFMKESLETGNQAEALQSKSTTVRQVKELTTTFKPDMLNPYTKADIVFTTLADLSAECQNYGKVFAASSPDPSQCCATGKGVHTALVWENSTAILHTLNYNGEPCDESINSVTCELDSEIAGTSAKGCIERIAQNEYEISYQPTIKGRHQLHIKVEGQHIGGSPFLVSVRSPMKHLGTLVLDIRGVRKPEGVAVNRRGEVVVTEGGEHCITIFSPSMKKQLSVGTNGSKPGQFQNPLGVAVDDENSIYVSDYYNHRIQKFTAEGDFIKAAGTRGSGPLKFDSPRGISFNANNGRIYVVDAGNGRIQILNSELGYLGAFGKKGSGKGQFNDPWHLACDSNGNVYVADCNNHRIQAFSAEGKLLRMFGRRGEFWKEELDPVGVAIDSSDRVYISEWGNHRVSVFTTEGQFLTSFSKKTGRQERARGLAVDPSGMVYVCSYDTNHLQLY